MKSGNMFTFKSAAYSREKIAHPLPTTCRCGLTLTKQDIYLSSWTNKALRLFSNV